MMMLCSSGNVGLTNYQVPDWLAGWLFGYLFGVGVSSSSSAYKSNTALDDFCGPTFQYQHTDPSSHNNTSLM